MIKSVWKRRSKWRLSLVGFAIANQIPIIGRSEASLTEVENVEHLRLENKPSVTY